MKLRLLLFLCVITFNGFAQNNVLVFQSDFGLKDGAVSAMKGVAMGVSTDIKIFDVIFGKRRIVCHKLHNIIRLELCLYQFAIPELVHQDIQ
jgi:hypothetical protein